MRSWQTILPTARAAAAAIEPMAARLRRGRRAPREWLLRCEEEGRDGTRLSGCVKLSHPSARQAMGAVLAGDDEPQKPASVAVALGERHPTRPWKPSVYEIAHRRLHM